MPLITLFLSLTALVLLSLLSTGPRGPAVPAELLALPSAESSAELPTAPLGDASGATAAHCRPDARADGPAARRVAELEQALAASRRRHAEQATAQARVIATLEARIAQLQQARTKHAGAADRDAQGGVYAQAHADRDAALFALEERLAAQPVDPDWERAIELDVFELFAASPGLDGNALVYTSCGSTFCRVEFEHADAAAESRLLAAVAQRSAWSANYQDVFQYRAADDQGATDALTSVFFVSRRGFALPLSQGSGFAD
jgi:hypothetical protein